MIAGLISLTPMHSHKSEAAYCLHSNYDSVNIFENIIIIK